MKNSKCFIANKKERKGGVKKIIVLFGMIMLISFSFLYAETYDDVENELEGESSQKMKEDFKEYKEESKEDFKQFKEEIKEEFKDLKKEIAEDKKNIKDLQDTKAEMVVETKKEIKMNEEALWQENKAKNAQEELDKETSIEKKAETVAIKEIVEIKKAEREEAEEPKEIQKEETKEEVKPEVKEMTIVETTISETSTEKINNKLLVIIGILVIIAFSGILAIRRMSKKE